MKKYLLTIITIAAIAAWISPVTAYEAEGIDIHGFISQGFLDSCDYNYLTHNSKDGSFEYNEMGINFGTELTDKLRVGVQFFARDLGDAANNKISLDWAYGDYRWKDWLGFRVGKIKLPLGLHNESRDMDMLRTSIMLPQGIYTDLTRDNFIATKGFGIYGNKLIGKAGGLSYQLLTGVLDPNNASGAGKLLENGLAAYGGELIAENDAGTNYSGAFWWETPMEGLKVGASFFHTYSTAHVALMGGAIQTDQNIKMSLYILSAEYTWDKLTAQAEYMEREASITLMSNENISTSQSYYFLLSYAINDLITLGAYYSETYPNEDDKDGSTLAVNHKAWEKDIAVSIRFDINEYWVAKIEGHRVDGTANVIGIDNPDNSFSESKFNYVAAKMTFNF